MKWRRLVIGVLGTSLLSSACGTSSASKPAAASARTFPSEPTAGAWKPWVLSAPDQIAVPAPPRAGSEEAKAEVAELEELAASRSPEAEREAHRWSDYPAVEPWVKENMALVAEQSKNPPLASRGYGLVSVAIYDALVATWHWKYVYKRKAPTGAKAVVDLGADPSYPNEHAAMAGAASRVMAYLFPERPAAAYDAQAEAAAESRVVAGANYRSDVDAGLALGRAVAAAVIAKAKTDGYDRHFEGTIPTGVERWAPPPGARPDQRQPVEPLAGTWKTWVTDVTTVRPPPPPAYGSETFVAEAKEVLETSRKLTDKDKEIARFWAGGAGTPLPPGIWNQILLDTLKRYRTSLPHQARAFALMNVAQSDAGVAAWDCKYAFWSPRPVNAVRDLGLDAQFQSFLPTPVFPSYISGHSTYSAASAEVLAHLFPAQAKEFRARAEEAAQSRLLGGIHFRSDNEAGLTVGTKVGRLVVEWARQDGARTRPDVGRTTVAAGGDRTQADGAKGDHAAEKGRKSLPYWIPVTTLRGTGEATTDSFTIDATALQWRLRWRCETTPFTVVGVDVKGKASKRKLANALLCPEEAEGFSGDKGRQALKVTTPGAWTLVVEEQVDRPLVEPPTPAMSAATVMGTGEVYGVDRQGEGKATVYRLADGT
jgi:membrane-associated phospholipid phosphatase